MIQQKSPPPPLFRRFVGVIILAIIYYATAEISRHVASTPQEVTPVWPPDGIGVGAVLLFGNWIKYGIFLGSFLANFWAFQDSTNLSTLIVSTLPVLGIAIGTTLGTLLGVFLLRKFTQGGYPLDRVTGVFQFLALTGMVGPIVNATVGVACLTLSGKVPWTAYSTVWLIWWISNVSGIFTVTPILISWGQLFQEKMSSIWRRQYSNLPSENPEELPQNQRTSLPVRFEVIFESGILLGIVLLISQVAFGEGYHLEYMLIPVLLWSSFRLGQRGATLLTFAVAAIAVIATVNGRGSFIAADINQSLIQLQLFIGAITLTILLLTATIAERAQSETKLRLAFAELARSNETLESRVQQRTEELNERNATLKQTLETLKRTQLQILQSEKMSALGQMIAGIAHEINNPISFIHGNIKHVNTYAQDLLKIVQEYQAHYPHPPQVLQKSLDEVEI